MTELQLLVFSFFLVVLILLAAFFSCAETSLMALNRYRLRHKARMKQRYALRLLKLLKRPDRLLGAILIGNTFANMLASALATLLAAHYWGETGALICAIMLAMIVLIFAEIMPKTLAALYPDTIARWMAYPIELILTILYPAVWVANVVTNTLLGVFKVKVYSEPSEPLTRDELRSMVYDSGGKISRQYQNMLLGILDLNKLTVDDVMIPQHEISGIDIQQPMEAILEQLKLKSLDWVLFYRKHLDQVVGILHLRELAHTLLVDKKQRKEFQLDALQQILREPYFVPVGTPLSIQLSYFQQHQEKIAFVVDEYGEIQGMLTMNDILEEIVGDFTKKLATVKRIEQQTDGSYLVDGAVTVREFNRMTESELPVHGPKTINGLIIEYLESLPHVGTTVLIGYYPIEIIQVKENRVKLARVFSRLER